MWHEFLSEVYIMRTSMSGWHHHEVKVRRDIIRHSLINRDKTIVDNCNIDNSTLLLVFDFSGFYCNISNIPESISSRRHVVVELIIVRVGVDVRRSSLLLHRHLPLPPRDHPRCTIHRLRWTTGEVWWLWSPLPYPWSTSCLWIREQPHVRA